MRLAALALGVLALLVVGIARAVPVSAASGYRPPVDAPVTDGFRPPARQYGSGNRGLEYGTSPGVDVRAASDGDVVFAGQVGGELHVVILHPDGLRTTYAFLSTIRVHRGDAVRQGHVVGTTGVRPFHFGVRAGDVYLDPVVLFGAGPPEVHLVPEHERRPAPESEERGGVLAFLGGLPERAGDVAGVGADAVGWAAGKAVDAGTAALRHETIDNLARLRDLVEWCAQQSPPAHALAVAQGVAGLFSPGECTPAGVEPPKVHGHIAVLVGGLGSSGAATGGGAAVFRVDTAALGYQRADVVRFSYRGGTAAEHPYGKADTEVDIRLSGQRLRALLERLEQEHPGVPVDILAHSQGGLVTRAALAEYDHNDARLAQLGAVVTMGSPHNGTDGATTLAMIRRSPVADPVLAGVHAALPNADDPRAVSIAQMAEGSSFIRELNREPVPDGVFFTSIAAREDWLVPSPNADLKGAHNTVVSVGGLTAHDGLPASTAALRETALALNHMAPTCRDISTRLADGAEGLGMKLAHKQLRAQFFPSVGVTP